MIPTRSQVEAYTIDHLVDAAEYWDHLADHWEDAHWQVRNQAQALDWQGVGGDALRARTASDTPLPATTPTSCAVPHASPVDRPASWSAYAIEFSTRSRTLTTPVSPSGRTCRSPILNRAAQPLSWPLVKRRPKFSPQTFAAERVRWSSLIPRLPAASPDPLLTLALPPGRKPESRTQFQCADWHPAAASVG